MACIILTVITSYLPLYRSLLSHETNIFNPQRNNIVLHTCNNNAAVWSVNKAECKVVHIIIDTKQLQILMTPHVHSDL